MVALFALACVPDGRPRPVDADRSGAVVLSELPFAELEVPPDNRPDHAAPPLRIPLDGPWDGAGSGGGRVKWAMQVPIRPRGMFFYRPTAGMRVLGPEGAELPYQGGEGPYAWSYNRERLVIGVPNDAGAPVGFVLEFPLAVERESALNRVFSGEEPAAFVWTTIQDDWDSRRGLLLPAPGRAAWDLDVPPSAELLLVPGLVEPEIRTGPASDGATLVVEVEAGGEVETVFTRRLAIRAFREERVDLSRWAGQRVRLRFRTDPSGTATYDYVFLGEPLVASRRSDPTRVLMVFVDTLRPDHMSLYGYGRDTTAALDPLAAEAVVFTNARTVAPWTLPSARTIVTGRYPERYGTSTTVQDRLHDAGYATAFFAGNVYLSPNFEMNRDWDLHRIGGLWPLAEDTTDQALAWLDAHDGRDVLLQVHYMSPHLPYVEPPSYRRRYAGDPVGGLREGFELSDVRRARPDKDPALQQYLKDRYDNNVRYATDQVRRLVDRLDDNDVLLIYADHGEEFWDHGGFEHGHTLFDELLRVPLVVKGPGVKPARVDAPVSLLDLTPTLLDLVGLPLPDDLDGRSLGPILRGERDADAPFRARDLAFGHPLYGQERWGVLHGAEKWSTQEGREALYDLATDPGERTNRLADDTTDGGAPYREYLAGALGRDVAVGYRLTPTPWKGPRPIPGLWALCTVPGGFAEAWAGDDPLQTVQTTVRRVDDPAEIRRLVASYQVDDHVVADDAGAVEVCWHPGGHGSREIYVVPRRPLADAGRAMTCSGYLGDATGGKRATVQIAPQRDPTLAGARTPLQRITWDHRQLLWQFGIGPVPDATTQALDGRDPETDDMLAKLGYTDPDAPEGVAADAPPEAVCVPPSVALPPLAP